ncbi:wax ester/triacylglycerol synthase domain-containing protein [Microbacterium ulmi]|uniref:O-acyltransferase WSD1-like N-terminal domain-containing protein n=1 Tax=Microbacterium ulmi TaxID=179095 RepID=A0A7Y2M0Y6_9MICO|nr:wax ester/triacylglycerol synthase domain-containing protein [Microbacterium ulmi]NII69466.1 hypothetical protein [Microbacterium ulmi]NNH04424.1 hypothetical protein [Microbacterium ulmi]
MSTPVHLDLVRTLDEQNISTSIAYEAAHTGAVLVLDGEPFRLPDGRLDRARLLAQVRTSLARVPEFSLRLMMSPLGITTPAWVPVAGFDPALQVTFDDEDAELTDDTLRSLAGFGGPVLPIDRPLWDIRFTSLSSGEIALGSRMHHVVGDGQWGFSVIQRVTSAEPSAPDPSVGFDVPGRAPRTSLAVPVHALRAFLRAHPIGADAWREYWRKPFLKRVKRLAGRNARFAREYWIRRRGLRAVFLPPTHLSVFEVPASPAARQAARLRGSLNDLLVAAAMSAVDDDDRGVDVLVPVSHRRGGAGGDVRNHVSMVRAHGEPGADLAARVASVRAIVRAVVKGEEVQAAAGRLVGYATLMPLAEHPVWFGDALVRHVAIIPAGDPRSEISVFATVYAETLSVTVISRLELDVDRMAAAVAAGLTGAARTAGERSQTAEEAAA